MGEMPFPSRAEIEAAWVKMGFDPNAPESPPTCDKCGAPIESGFISMACPWGRDCAMTDPETWDRASAIFGQQP